MSTIVLPLYTNKFYGFIPVKEAEALVLLDFGILFRIFYLRSVQIIVLLLLVTLLFGNGSTSYTTTKFNGSVTYNFTEDAVYSNLFVSVIIAIDLIFSWIAIKDIYMLIRYFNSNANGNDVIINESDVYYTKFKDYSDIEISKIENNIDLYLPAAQQAIKKIVSERADVMN